MKTIKAFPILLAIVMTVSLASCGEQSDAEGVVRHFMKENLIEPKSLSDVEFANIDSTKLITPRIVDNMRRMAPTTGLYRPDIHYADNAPQRMLYSLRVNYKVGERECVSTFYLDEQLHEVVAFKTN